MKTSLAGLLIFIQLCEAGAELVFECLTEGQSLVLSCSPQKNHGSPSGLHLYHRWAQSQTTLLSLSEAGEVRVDPEVRTRLQLRGGLDSLNVTISQVQLSDTGLYMWELSYREENSSDQSILSTQRVFLLVEGRSCWCSQSYPPLLWTIFTAAGLLLVTLSWLAIDKCVKTRPRHRPQPHVPIYEEMSRKQQRPGSPQNNQEAPSHLEEVSFPVYANPNIRQPQDNYYACPRQLALRA
ncbi:cd7 antigen-like [Amphiprion ocellaris]|uniref:cd7 antigen-like n=1 Tax=Amphiprion ocellaris TaxID=80972 RepID=UPI002410C933|nr:cd7 antigen-like [Amphiprion ocellaris]